MNTIYFINNIVAIGKCIIFYTFRGYWTVSDGLHGTWTSIYLPYQPFFTDDGDFRYICWNSFLLRWFLDDDLGVLCHIGYRTTIVQIIPFGCLIWVTEILVTVLCRYNHAIINVGQVYRLCSTWSRLCFIEGFVIASLEVWNLLFFIRIHIILKN